MINYHAEDEEDVDNDPNDHIGMHACTKITSGN